MTETSDRAFEEEVMLAGFGNPHQRKAEGAGVSCLMTMQPKRFTARYTHETIALSFRNHRRSYRR